MNNESFETLLDQAERDFRTEVADIELIGGSPQRQPDEAGDFDGAGKHPEDLAGDLRIGHVDFHVRIGVESGVFDVAANADN